ncbi:hypothetical protein KDA_72860 [Dictyobacter alpinus]|uniref:Major facilitator superfamily (MFS) profile domain-containing protein n=1 Tax=Dictyobacter alpinus TaxID=2014873 RepID=A0A402BKE1_9CHLR|nr:MFS transporter [Dictyobacter alpinus]GCE31802.1 hypothetical protein KDA_72860 [Dictyobacter alpinus]
MTLHSQSEAEKWRLHLARMAVNIYFFVNGVLTATFSTRLPTLQMKLALPPGQLGLALLGCTIGGLLAISIAGHVSSRFGSKVITIIAALAMCVSLSLITLAPTLPLFLLALIFFGVASGAMDVTMNFQGTDVEQAYGRSIMNSFHAYFSVGSLTGASLGSLLAAFDVQPETHFFAIAIAGGAALVWSTRFLLASQQKQVADKQPVLKALSAQISPTLILLGIIAFCSLLSVGALFDWSAVYISSNLHTGTGLAAAGFTTFLACMALGRSVGDRMAERFGAPRLVRIACALAASGLTLALAFPWAPAVFFGLGLVGIGLSIPFPLVLSAAAHHAGPDKDVALATVTTWGYAGMIVGPPMIGFLAEQAGMRLALVPVVLLCLIAALCAPATHKTALQTKY